MCYRVRLETTLQNARNQKLHLDHIEATVRADFEEAIGRFRRASELSPSSEYGHVATIQMVSRLVRHVMALANVPNLGAFIKIPKYRWIVIALSAAEESIAVLRNRPDGLKSNRAKRTIAEWDLVYGNIDSVVSQLRLLVQGNEDTELRRALCSAMLARYRRQWKEMPQADLQTVTTLMEKNIQSQAFRESDIRNWLQAYRHLRTFEIEVAIERLIDWHSLRPTANEPPFYLYLFNVLRWLNSAAPNVGYADEINRWLGVCRENRMLGQRSWGFEWLVQSERGYSSTHFMDLLVNPVHALHVRGADAARELAQFARVTGTVTRYHGPQRATLDLGQGLLINFVPLAKVTRDHVGRRASVMVSFTYDGPRGWDPQLVEGKAVGV